MVAVWIVDVCAERLQTCICNLGRSWLIQFDHLLPAQLHAPKIILRLDLTVISWLSLVTSSVSFSCCCYHWTLLYLFCLFTLLSHLVSFLSPSTQLLPQLDSASSLAILSKLIVLSTSDGTEIVEGRSERRENLLHVGSLKGEDFN